MIWKCYVRVKVFYIYTYYVYNNILILFNKNYIQYIIMNLNWASKKFLFYCLEIVLLYLRVSERLYWISHKIL